MSEDISERLVRLESGQADIKATQADIKATLGQLMPMASACDA
jgi:hypothetical protein